MLLYINVYIFQSISYYIVIKMSPTEPQTIENYLSNQDRGSSNLDSKVMNMAEDTVSDIEGDISKFYKMHKKVKHIVASRQKIHSEAYHAGMKAVEKNGEVDWDALEDTVNQEKIADNIANYYLEKAKKYLHVKEDHKFADKEDEKLHNDQLLFQYAGLTKEMIRNSIKEIVKQDPAAFSEGTYMKLTGKHTERLKGELGESASAHITKEHAKGVVDYIKRGGKHPDIDTLVDANLMKKEHIVDLLGEYDEGKGAITENFLKTQDYITKSLREKLKKKKPAEEKKYEPKYEPKAEEQQQYKKAA
jgi:hypothetical protein